MKKELFNVVSLPVSILSISLAVFGFIFIYVNVENQSIFSEFKETVYQNQAKNDERISLLKGQIEALAGWNNSLLSIIKENEAISGEVRDRLGALDQTVGSLQKLSTMDPELLKKYSKIYFLNEHYVPSSLLNIDQKYLYNKTNIFQIHSNVYPFLTRMLDDAENNGIDLKVLSAFRSFGSQASLKSSYKFTYGAGTANSFSAEQGYSEHQLGTTLDFTNQKIGGTFRGFDATKEFEWLKNNAHKYGFILSYPKENSYYTYEPWHWRFVGVALASFVHEKNTYFYAVDQREIDTYLGKLFDQ